MSISIKDVLETISDAREALIQDYNDNHHKDEDYVPTEKELFKHIVYLFTSKEYSHLDLIQDLGVPDIGDEDFYAALLLVSAAKIGSEG